ncbi:MAG: PilN domain-containing protein, partial [Mariniphaga sp.]
LKPVKESLGIGTNNDLAKSIVKSVLPATFGILAFIITVLAIANLNIGKNIDNYRRSIAERQVTLSNLKSYNSQKNTIDKLNGNRRPIGPAMIELANILPKDVSLDTINFNGSLFTIDGKCKEMDTVSSTIKIIQNAKFLQSPLLIQAKRTLVEVPSGLNKATNSYVQFQMTFVIR